MNASEPAANAPPFPPLELANRVGCITTADDPWWFYDQLGLHARRSILELLPEGWTFTGRRVLDFGCGAGRTLRHFLEEARVAEVYGCDVDSPSIEWLEAELSPPLRVFRNEEEPPLPFGDGELDLVWAVSVFTHLTDAWARWACELHRVLKPDGLLVVSFLGRENGAALGEPWSDDRVGMNVVNHGLGWDEGGPWVFCSEWWVRARWGRVYEILTVAEPAFSDQWAALMRPRLVEARPELLERRSDDPREETALLASLEQARREAAALRAECRELRAQLDAVHGSRSWRLTAPLRTLRARGRRRGYSP